MRYTSINSKTGFKLSCNLKCVQCNATKPNGQRCKNRVCVGVGTCHAHRKKKLGVHVKKSNIPNGGKGLFASHDFAKNDIIGQYAGEKITVQQNKARHGGSNNDHNAYGLQVGKHIIDASCKRGIISLANGSKAKTTSNAKFMGKMLPNGTANVRATKANNTGDEIILHYGRGYFKSAKYHKHKTK